MAQTLNNTVITQETQIGNISDQFDSIVTNLSMFKTHISLLQQQVRALDKIVKKQMNLLKKESSKNKNKNKASRKPSGFARPTRVTKELCEFMNKTEGTEIARTEVTRALVAYIKDQQLEDKINSRIIIINYL